MVNDRLSRIRACLSNVMDPELPFLTITELGMVRGCEFDENDTAVILLTPTYSGCPATDAIQDDIRDAVSEFESNFRVKLVHSPAWTTDWIDDAAREKMRQHGIAPPDGNSADKAFLLGKERQISCPRCRSAETKMISAFGSTACKAHFQCESCLEPFDHFKCI